MIKAVIFDLDGTLVKTENLKEAKRVLHILNLHDKFAFVATRDDVEHGKPNPEIYLLVARQLGTPSGAMFGH